MMHGSTKLKNVSLVLWHQTPIVFIAYGFLSAYSRVCTMLCILEEGMFGVHTRKLIFTLQNVMTNPKNICMDFEDFIYTKI
jgi:hypothetical protein